MSKIRRLVWKGGTLFPSSSHQQVYYVHTFFPLLPVRVCVGMYLMVDCIFEHVCSSGTDGRPLLYTVHIG